MRTRNLTLMLAGLAMLGPFSIDTYLPSFPSIARDLQVDILLLQQSLSVYLFSFAFMMLFHGSLSDAFGRKPVILVALVVYAAASAAAIFAPDLHILLVCRALQGVSAGAGMVVGRAIVRDRLSGADAQRMLAQITIVFGLAPAIAPIIGGWLQNLFGWRAVFVFLTAVSILLLITSAMALPESLPPDARQPLHLRGTLRNYWRTLTHPRFMLMAAAVGFGFSGFGLYIAAAPDFIMNVLRLPETAFAWLFIPLIGGQMLGAYIVSRNSGGVSPARLIRNGYILMTCAAGLNLLYNALFPAQVPWAVLPLSLYSFGVALIIPSLTLKILDLFPHTRGLSASLQSFIQTLIFALIAAIAPVFFGHPLKLAGGLALALGCSLTCYMLSLHPTLIARQHAREKAQRVIQPSASGTIR
jgi:DHA1 family bicyclomycin/chloramphenicol resistance-like MFS transporter